MSLATCGGVTDKQQEEKRQHAIDHPGYKYQPRKPSEKKKRMTKNKLAKLAAQSSSTDATTNATNLPAQQNGQTTVNTSMPPDQNDTSQLITHNDDPLGSFNVVQGPQSPAWDIFLPADELSYMAGERAEQLRQERFVGETEDVDSWFDMVAYVEGLGPVQDWVNDNA